MKEKRKVQESEQEIRMTTIRGITRAEVSPVRIEEYGFE
jgi:hypothetical protein